MKFNLLALEIVVTAALCATAAQADLVVSNKATQNVTCSGGVCTATAAKAVLNVTDLAAMLATGDVTVTSGGLAKDIDIDAALSWVSSHLLRLDSYHSISFQKLVSVAGAGRLAITTNDGGAGGDYRFSRRGRVEFWGSGASLTINNNPYILVEDVKALRLEIRRGGGGIGTHYALRKNASSNRQYFTSPVDINFEGTFEGLGNTISNLHIDATTGGAIGLFSGVGLSGAIRDLSLKNVNISASGAAQVVGPLAGGSTGLIANCHSSGEVSASGANSKLGGLIGGSDGRIVGSSSTASVFANGSGEAAGGLAGESVSDDLSLGRIGESYATATVTGTDGATVGGLVGENVGTALSNSYAMGNVTGGCSSLVGGLVGANSNNSDLGWEATIASSYSTGAVSGGSAATVGGLIGNDVAGTKNMDLYWDLDTSGVSDPHHGAGNIADDPGITGLADAQLKSALPASFDEKVWKQSPNVNNGYPYLADNAPPK